VLNHVGGTEPQPSLRSIQRTIRSWKIKPDSFQRRCTF